MGTSDFPGTLDRRIEIPIVHPLACCLPRRLPLRVAVCVGVASARSTTR